ERRQKLSRVEDILGIELPLQRPERIRSDRSDFVFEPRLMLVANSMVVRECRLVTHEGVGDEALVTVVLLQFAPLFLFCRIGEIEASAGCVRVGEVAAKIVTR